MMKKVVLALVAALLLAGMVMVPAQAAACGDTYTVKSGDYLSKIATTCSTTLQALIKANPEIKDINKIYPGQVIRIKASATVPTTTPVPSSSGTYTVVKGDTLQKIATRFSTTVTAILAVNPEIKSASLIYVGQVIKLPAGATGSRISLSATSAKKGAQVEVKVWGFPANAELDFRLGKQNAAYTVVYDGKTNANGEATLKVTIPDTAVVGEKWVVKVITTSLRVGTETTSPLITIVQ
jgi:LysM repeat protein